MVSGGPGSWSKRAAGSRAAVASALLVVLSACGHPTDEEVREQFLEHRGALEAMIDLFKQGDGLHCVTEEFYTLPPPDNSYLDEPSPAMSAERWDRFRSRLVEAGMSRACDVRAEHDGKDYFSFLVASSGTVFRSSYTSIAHIDPAAPQRSSRGTSRSTSLGDNWFITRDSD